MAEVFDFGLQQHKIKMDGKFFESNLFAVAGDTGRRLEVQLLDSNNMIQNTTGISLRLNANVAGQATYAEATLVDATKGLYELDLPNGMLLAPGNWQFQWQIIGTSGEKLHSFAFTGSVGSNLSEGGSEATNFYLNADDLKQMQEDLINGTFNSEVLETNIAEKLNNLEEQYAPKLTEVTAQLAEVDLSQANAPQPIGLGTCYGDNQFIHPKVLYFATAWNGYNYWMGYTPFPNYAEAKENPCIAASKDGIIWETPNGLTNPLVDNTGYDYNSDTHLVYRTDTNTLECWFRAAYNVAKKEEIYRMTSTNGIAWTAKELMYSPTSGLNLLQVLSPAIIWEDSKYKIWVVDNTVVKYYESADGKTWTFIRNLTLPLLNAATAWHIDVIHQNGKFEILISTKNDSEKLYYASSTDNINYTTPSVIIQPTKGTGWDNGGIYRSSLLRVGTKVSVYYSAYSKSGKWRTGISVSITGDLTNLQGLDTLNYEKQFFREIVMNNILDGKPYRLRVSKTGELQYCYGVNDSNWKALIPFETLPMKRVGTETIVNIRVTDDGKPQWDYSGTWDTMWGKIPLRTDNPTTKLGMLAYNATAVPPKYNSWNGTKWVDLFFQASVPTTSTSSGNKGDMAVTSSYLYICDANSHWIRIRKDDTVW